MPRTHPLKRYRRRVGLTLSGFAKLARAKSAGTINDIETRRRVPSMKMAKAISKATGYQVTVGDLANG